MCSAATSIRPSPVWTARWTADTRTGSGWSTMPTWTACTATPGGSGCWRGWARPQAATRLLCAPLWRRPAHRPVRVPAHRVPHHHAGFIDGERVGVHAGLAADQHVSAALPDDRDDLAAIAEVAHHLVGVVDPIRDERRCALGREIGHATRLIEERVRALGRRRAH